MRRTIEEFQDGGVEADVWKIEGIDTQEDCERIAQTARRDGRDGVICVVLGRGANDEKVEHWLRQGAPVDGYAGFAIGRTIWWDALKGFLDGKHRARGGCSADRRQLPALRARVRGGEPARRPPRRLSRHADATVTRAVRGGLPARRPRTRSCAGSASGRRPLSARRSAAWSARARRARVRFVLLTLSIIVHGRARHDRDVRDARGAGRLGRSGAARRPRELGHLSGASCRWGC